MTLGTENVRGGSMKKAKAVFSFPCVHIAQSSVTRA